MHYTQLVRAVRLSLVLVTCLISPTFSTEYILLVISSNGTTHRQNYECVAGGATFGRDMDGSDSITGCTFPASPSYACGMIAPPQNMSYSCIGRSFAVASRGNCSFAQKAYYAQVSGYEGIIIANYPGNDFPIDMGSNATYGPRVLIPAFMVGYQCGVLLANKYSYQNNYSIVVHVFWSYRDLLRYLVPFVSVVGVCFVVMLAAMIAKLVRDRRRELRRRLSKKHLKQIPTRKFGKKSEETAETCPICLEDFAEGDRLRVLPCNHSYHCTCIDPWLLKNRRICPICKRRVLRGHGGSDSESDTDDASAGPSFSAERMPLLREEDRSVTVGNSTFYGIFDAPSASTADVQGIILSPVSTPDTEQPPPLEEAESAPTPCEDGQSNQSQSPTSQGYVNRSFAPDVEVLPERTDVQRTQELPHGNII